MIIASSLRSPTLARRSLAGLALATLMAATAVQAAEPAAPASTSAKSVPEQTVDTLDKLSGGPHAGFRANHAKGLLVSGTFTAAPAAKTLSKAMHLQGKTVPVLVRFSNGTGVPAMPDADPNASPHGIAIRFQLPEDSYTDIVSISYNGFPAATPEDFLGLLNAIAASGPDAPSPKPIETFLAAHPAAKAFATDPKPAPVSFATLPFFGVNSFKFTNAKGKEQYARYRIVPVAGDHRLTAEQAKAAAPNYLADELKTRLAKGAAQFKLIAQLAKDGDAINDGSIPWGADHKDVLLGTIMLKKLVPDSAKAEKTLFFSPTNLVDGIAPSADPVLLARPVAYAVSVGRRVGK